MGKETVSVIIEGGKATPAPPIGPKFSPMGINVPKLVADINAKTKDFAGMKVPVDIIVDANTKTWEIKVGTPSASQLLFKELKLEGGSKNAWHPVEDKEKPPIVGNATMDMIVKIAKIKKDDIGAKSIKSAVKVILGSCVSAGITVEGKNPKEVIKEINDGKWDQKFK